MRMGEDMHTVLTPRPLTPEAFRPFGDVVETRTAVDERLINEGNTTRFHDLARLDLEADGGRPLLSIFRSRPLPAPVRITTMERHPLSSQMFYPLSGNPYLVVVAPPGELDESAIQVFRAGPNQGVNYASGTWHHYSLALDSISDFLVIDRGGPEENCDEVPLQTPLTIAL